MTWQAHPAVMTDHLSNAFFIAAAGLGLVLAVVLVVWATLWILMRGTADNELQPAPSPQPANALQAKRAAAAAAATLLARRHTLAHQPAPPSVRLSPWQAVTRVAPFARGKQSR